MNEEEKEAIEILKSPLLKSDGYDRHQKAIDIILKLIEKQQKEIEFYKMQELGYIAGYEDGKNHKQTAVAIKNEYAQQMLIQRKMEKYEKEIEKLKSRKYILNAETNEIKEIPISDDYISKDKIREKIEEITSYAYTSAEERDCQDYAIQILKELLGE